MPPGSRYNGIANLLLGLATLLPIPAFLAYVFVLVSGVEGTYLGYAFALAAAGFLAGGVGMVVLVLDAMHNDRVPETQRVTWAVALLVATPFTMPAYYLNYRRPGRQTKR